MMTSSPEVNSSQRHITWCTKDGGGLTTHNLAWMLCFVLTFVIGLLINVSVAYLSSRWRLFQHRLRHFRSLGDALIGQLVSGTLSCCCGLGIILSRVHASCQFSPEVACRAGAALPQLVLSSSTAVTILFAFSHCEHPGVSVCRRLQKLLSTVRKVTPLIIGLTTASFVALVEPSSRSWLDSGCRAADGDPATYRLATVLATVCFIASMTGTILTLSSHMKLRQPVTEVFPMPLMKLKTADNDDATRHVTSSDVTTTAAAQQTCRISCEAVAVPGRQDVDEAGSWRCSSKIGVEGVQLAAL